MENQKIPKDLGRIVLPEAQRKAESAFIYPEPAPVVPAPQPWHNAKPGWPRHNKLIAASAGVLLITLVTSLIIVISQLSNRNHLAKNAAISALSAKDALAASTSNKKSAPTSSSKTSSSKSSSKSQKKTSQPSKQIQQTPQQPVQNSSQPYVGSLPSTVPIYSSASFNFYYVGGRQYADASGAMVTLSQAQPTVPEQANAENHSLMELAVQSADGNQIVEVGWVVDKTMNGDDLPHLFVYHWVDRQISCYNGCGFVQVSSSIVPGQPVASGTSGSYGINYFGDNWDITYNGTDVGYFPGSLWGGAYTRLGYVQAFGEVAIGVNSTTKCIQMGNALPGTNLGSARISNFTLVGSSTPIALSPFATSPSSYSYGFVSATGLNLGGPGSC